MRSTDRIVTQLPLSELWDERGTVPAERGRDLDREQLRQLLQGPLIRFVVADPGHAPYWVPGDERFVFWKAEVRPRLVEHPERPFDIYTFPSGYAYVASEWVPLDPAAPRIVLLERHH